MLRSCVKWHTTGMTFLPRCGLHSTASPAEESQNVQNVAKLLNAVRQCNKYTRPLVSRIEKKPVFR